MESVELKVNGRSNTIHSNGSIAFVHGRTGVRINNFGSECNGYRQIRIGGKMVLVHRLIAQAFLPDYSDDLVVDHIDGNKSNNRLENLRMITNQKNGQGFNKKRKGCSSQYRGVSWYKNLSKWTASITCDRKVRLIGRFDTEVEAAVAYNAKATELGFLPEALNVIP